MARLPQPGGDDGIWGDLLNNYLLLTHNVDGSLKDSIIGANNLSPNAVTSAAVQNSSIVAAKLNAAGAVNDYVLTYDSATAGGFKWAAAPSAPTSLAVGGDLTGSTANAQIAAGAVGQTELATGAVTSAKIVDGSIAETDLDASVQAKLNTAGSVADGTLTPIKLNSDTPSSGEILSYNGSGFEWIVAPGGGGSGETNTASNVGTGGVGVYKQKTGVNLEFKNVAAASSKLTVVNNSGTNSIDLDVSEPNLNLANIGGSLPQASVTNLAASLAAKVDTSSVGAVNGVASLDGTGKVPSAQLPTSSPPADATTSTKGIVQLAGDLGGTAASPTVPGLAAKADDSAVVHNTGAETIAGVKTFSSSPVVPTPSTGTQAANKTYVDGAVAAGAPDATTTSKGIVQLAGDLGGTAVSPTVPALATKANTSTTISAGTGLSGGGDLSANRTLSVSYGTTAGTAAEGNDSRITGAEQTTNKGNANGYASLDGTGKVPTGQLPALGEANTASNVGTAGVGVYKQKTSLNLELKKINAASNKLLVVDNTTDSSIDLDVVTANLGLTKSDVGLGNVDNTSDTNKPISTATQTALNLKANAATTISAGTGLSGGGDLSANRTLTVSYGTTAGTAAQGNDSRITGAEQTANKGAANGYASLSASSRVPTAQLGSGTASATTYLRGDGAWIQPPGVDIMLPFSQFGATYVATGGHRVYVENSRTVATIRASVGIAPTGANLIVDVLKNGTSIFNATPANRPTIVAGTNTALSGVPDVTTFTTGDYITVDVLQVGSTVAGSDLTVIVRLI